MKKKIIIVSHNMELGGIEKSLLGLLQSFDYDNYDVDLFLFSHNGGLMKFIPKEVHILPELKYYSYINKGLFDCVKHGQVGIVISKILAHLKYRQFVSKNTYDNNDAMLNYLYSYANKLAPKISNIKYDLAISFSDVHYATIDKVKAKKKICWIHTDYSVTHQDRDFCLDMWNSYDKIIAVSFDCKKAFESSYPELSNKVIVIENTLSKQYVESESNEFSVKFNNNNLNILSIGRFCSAKNFTNVPKILKAIREKDIDAKWYLIGFGAQEDAIRKEIILNGMEEYVVLLGKQDNPYPYIKNCDVYIQPSIYEGKSVTVREAQMLGKPVIITNYPTSHSQIRDGFDGVIVPMDNQRCAEGIVKVINDKELQQRLIDNMKSTNYSNESEIEKLYELIGE